MIEVELKFEVPDLDALNLRLDGLNAEWKQSVHQSDEYLNDPLRDFAQTDQALRIRSEDDRFCLTYKGPNLDTEAKIRKEIETQLGNAEIAQQIRQTFLELGYVSVATVEKRRTWYVVYFDNAKIQVCLDEVVDVGNFCELELVVSDDSEIETAKQALVTLADSIGLSGMMRTSYLELLLVSQGRLSN
ncbi:MAG: class IV adenylate cyclase [Planctomycetota bacterium]